MSAGKVDPTKWAVSRGRNIALSKPLLGESDSVRFNILSNTLREVDDETAVVFEIDKLWSEAQDKFLTIGRYLVLAKRKFHRSYEATILPQLPFGKGVAYQLRAIAVAVDEGRLLEEEMPRSYATTYQLVSLPASHFDLARKENLVRRDVMRREVAAFRIKLRNQETGQDQKALLREKERLEVEIIKINKRLAEISSALG